MFRPKRYCWSRNSEWCCSSVVASNRWNAPASHIITTRLLNAKNRTVRRRERKVESIIIFTAKRKFSQNRLARVRSITWAQRGFVYFFKFTFCSYSALIPRKPEPACNKERTVRKVYYVYIPARMVAGERSFFSFVNTYMSAEVDGGTEVLKPERPFQPYS
jgi:hypothetical protein